MCDIILAQFDCIQTPREFKDYFGFKPIKEPLLKGKLNLDSCLCQCDIDETFRIHEVKYNYDLYSAQFNVFDR